MKILYAIQGTGNGHLSRACELIPQLKQLADVDVLISGSEHELNIPFEVKYTLHGIGFVFGTKGGINWLESFKKANFKRFIQEVNTLPVENYDLILNDFEPVSAWAAKIKGVDCCALSHQAAVMGKGSPRNWSFNFLAKAVLRHYAPHTRYVGFHFQAYNQNIFTPVIRQEIQQANYKNKGHYTVYLPAYADDVLISVLQHAADVQWHVFSKREKTAYKKGNVHVFPVDAQQFVRSFTQCSGVLCGAGFETPAEALFMGKKLMVIPMQGQLEQQYNAFALQQMGVTVLNKLSMQTLEAVFEWLDSPQRLQVPYKDNSRQALQKAIGTNKTPQTAWWRAAAFLG